MRRIATALVMAGSVLLLSLTAQTQSPKVERGQVLAQANCARCHAIGLTGESPLAKAPPFRTLHRRYPVETLAEAFAEGIRAAHPMPEFRLEPGQMDELIAYLKSLER